MNLDERNLITRISVVNFKYSYDCRSQKIDAISKLQMYYIFSWQMEFMIFWQIL